MMKKILILYLIVMLPFIGKSQNEKISFTPSSLTPIAEMKELKMDTLNGHIVVSTLTEKTINIQVLDIDSLKKTREINFPLTLPVYENIADFYLHSVTPLTLILKTYTPENIYIKAFISPAAGLFNSPIILLQTPNQQLLSLLDDKSIKESANLQVGLVFAPNHAHFAIVNKQSLVCDTNSNNSFIKGNKLSLGLIITCFNEALEKTATFQSENCSFRVLHLFNGGDIAFVSEFNEQIRLQMFTADFKNNYYSFIFPELLSRSTADTSWLFQRIDTFDQQVQFYFDDHTIYGLVKGFVNNNYISHLGLMVYDVKNKKLDTTALPALRMKETFLAKYTLKGFQRAYSLDYPLRFQLKSIQRSRDGGYRVIASYETHGKMPLSGKFAGQATSEATFAIALNRYGVYQESAIILHKQNSIIYPDEPIENPYSIGDNRINHKIGVLHFTKNDTNFIIQNDDKKAYYSYERLYKFTYMGKEGVLGMVDYGINFKNKSKLLNFDNIQLLPGLGSLHLSKERAMVFALAEGVVKLIEIKVN